MKKVVKNLVTILPFYLRTKNNMNGNATNEGEDEDKLKLNGNVDENKPKVSG
jgi:hypothetical protein